MLKNLKLGRQRSEKKASREFYRKRLHLVLAPIVRPFPFCTFLSSLSVAESRPQKKISRYHGFPSFRVSTPSIFSTMLKQALKIFRRTFCLHICFGIDILYHLSVGNPLFTPS